MLSRDAVHVVAPLVEPPSLEVVIDVFEHVSRKFVFLHRFPSQLRWLGWYAGNLMTSLNCGMQDNKWHLANWEWTRFKWRTCGMVYWTGETTCLRLTVFLNVTLWEESISQLNLLPKVYCMLPYLAERWEHRRSNTVTKIFTVIYLLVSHKSSLLFCCQVKFLGKSICERDVPVQCSVNEPLCMLSLYTDSHCFLLSLTVKM